MSTAEEIQRLNDLKEAGVISPEEFETSKADLLQGIGKSEGFSLPSASDNQWAMGLHLSQFAGCIIPIAGLIAPIILWQIKKDEIPGIDEHGKIIANWLLSSFIYAIISAVLCLVGIGIIGLFALIILGVVFPIIGAVKANKGEIWPYPLSIRFFK